MPWVARRHGVVRVSSTPNETIDPELALMAPPMARSRVVLPAPFGPRMATASPGATVIETPRSATALP